MSLNIVTVNNITDALENNQILILDFWASWCEPCKVMGPIFERVALHNPDLFFGKINTETEHILNEDFNIRSIPTIIIMKEKTIIWEHSGVLPEYMLTQTIEKARNVDVNTL